MDKREFIKNYIDDVKNEDSITFIYYFIKGSIDDVLKKREGIKNAK